jgi:hypothetical protein
MAAADCWLKNRFWRQRLLISLSHGPDRRLRIPIRVQWDRPLKRSAFVDPQRGIRIAYFSAIFQRPKPNDGHSSASDLATNASGGVQVDAAGGPGDVVVALADGCMAGMPRGAVPPTGHHLKASEGRAIHHRPDRP